MGAGGTRENAHRPHPSPLPEGEGTPKQGTQKRDFAPLVPSVLSFLALVWLVVLAGFVQGEEHIVTMLLDGGESAWQRLGNETIPPEEDLATLADLANKLARWIPRSFWKAHAVDFPSLHMGDVMRLEGTVIFAANLEGVYRCTMILHDGSNTDIFLPRIPQAWQLDVPIQERAAAFSVYIKSYQNTPVFAAPSIQWFPDTWIGNLGFDVGSLEQVPVSRVTAAEQNDEETNYRAFRFTDSDVEPFYGLLRAVSAAPDGSLEEEAKKLSIGVTDLFNRPHETRGKPVLLRGTAKRIVPTPVSDSTVQSQFGIDLYYQIYLFTEQSRGNPIVVCVRSLPDGMPVGDSADFSEPMTVAAVPYKLWIYDTPEGQHYAPILIGRSLEWHPKPMVKRQPPTSVTSFSFALFCILAVIWAACRFWVKRSFT